MKKILLSVMLTLLVTGCANIQALIPSFWDDNQSARAVSIRQSVVSLQCSQPLEPQVRLLLTDIEWFKLYSDSKGTRQKDVTRIIAPLEETAQDLMTRARGTTAVNPTYCEIKKRIMTEQAARAAKAILGRF
jgi:hypothetical protein